ncbi:MAG: prepilin-type N-terminal cleavage/methylation domain-containing protein [Solobacterium sp.]|nr:prepilin-type N-terminal cleavage/methylation domain-containing protein [Solobacterium sp.]MCH4222085.1 prepilin-type N-terminal cleavage/methylation domain-containing protein [Solobacterium sp.]MCH4265784.1 prepilin-type N-terminal cleavage/methylation domain-containing protein [Solobacterium sp.]
MTSRKNKKGFTLAELLVVVAIIAVLVAVSVPIFTAQLEKAREATDVANLRAAKAEATATVLGGEPTDTTDKAVYDALIAGTPVYYDADNGKLVLAANKPATGYGKGTATDGGTTYGSGTSAYTGKTEASGKTIGVTYTASSQTFVIAFE